MGRFREASIEDSSESGIDISPLIDCVFILLIFFIVTTVFVEETGVEVNKPQAASASELESTSILFAITSEGHVMYSGNPIGIGGVRSIVQRMVQQDPKRPVIIQSDSDAPSGLLVRVMDEAKLGNAETVNIATRAN